MTRRQPQGKKMRAVPEANRPAIESGRTEQAYRALFQSLNDGFCIIEVLVDGAEQAVDFLCIDANAAFERQFGAQGRRGAETGPLFAATGEALSKVALSGEPARFEYCDAASDRWFDASAYPVDPPEMRRVAVLLRDITDHKRAESALRESEERLRMALEAGRMGAWRFDLKTGAQEWSRKQFELFGLEPDAGPPTRDLFLSLVLPEDLPVVEFGPQDLLPGRGFLDSEFRIRRPNGEIRWLVGHTVLRRGADGEALEMIGLNWDITERKRAEAALRETQERLQVLVSELQHRTRNLIAVVRAMAHRTMRSSATLSDFMTRFQVRLGALARVQGLASRVREGRPITFDALIESELAAHAEAGEAGRVRLIGPKAIGLRPGAVQSLAMALHELTTNAVKYGAFRHKNGRLVVRWSLEKPEDGGERWLSIDWKESGVEIDARPAHKGQGRELIERALPYQFGARTTFDMEPDGVRCTIRLPLNLA
jgi:PAS domain S-box-containing protein